MVGNHSRTCQDQLTLSDRCRLFLKCVWERPYMKRLSGPVYLFVHLDKKEKKKQVKASFGLKGLSLYLCSQMSNYIKTLLAALGSVCLCALLCELPVMKMSKPPACITAFKAASQQLLWRHQPGCRVSVSSHSVWVTGRVWWCKRYTFPF